MEATARSSNIKTEILSAATHLFGSQGFDGTSLAQIAQRVGLRKPSLLHHFPSKEHLRRAVLDELLARWNDALPQVLLAATSGEDQFDAVSREILAFFVADPDRARLLIREALDRPDDMRERVGRYLGPVFANLASTIRRGKNAGRIGAGVDPEAYLFQMVVLLVTGVVGAESFGGLLPAESFGSSQQRLRSELARVAKTSLFGVDKGSAVQSSEQQ